MITTLMLGLLLIARASSNHFIDQKSDLNSHLLRSWLNSAAKLRPQTHD